MGVSMATLRRYLAAGMLAKHQPGGPRNRILIPVSELTAPLSTASVSGATSIKSSLESSGLTAKRAGPTPAWMKKLKRSENQS